MSDRQLEVIHMVWSLWRGLLDVKRADALGAVTHLLLLIRWSYVAEGNGQEWNGQLLESSIAMTDG
ncbi:unnamed protein product [Clonostachys rhizophaga]|uniref:Uncharacterized protein n=1 Tax=Clonostachys rhizophaga TaxID=160324 RepID=A0A9N9YEL4_9HYPO|nr:unnamed protein product [Clonostachys rhizophaga]